VPSPQLEIHFCNPIILSTAALGTWLQVNFSVTLVMVAFNGIEERLNLINDLRLNVPEVPAVLPTNIWPPVPLLTAAFS
jgi:hypothetical protein